MVEPNASTPTHQGFTFVGDVAFNVWQHRPPLDHKSRDKYQSEVQSQVVRLISMAYKLSQHGPVPVSPFTSACILEASTLARVQGARKLDLENLYPDWAVSTDQYPVVKEHVYQKLHGWWSRRVGLRMMDDVEGPSDDDEGSPDHSNEEASAFSNEDDHPPSDNDAGSPTDEDSPALPSNSKSQVPGRVQSAEPSGEQSSPKAQRKARLPQISPNKPAPSTAQVPGASSARAPVPQSTSRNLTASSPTAVPFTKVGPPTGMKNRKTKIIRHSPMRALPSTAHASSQQPGQSSRPERKIANGVKQSQASAHPTTKSKNPASMTVAKRGTGADGDKVAQVPKKTTRAEVPAKRPKGKGRKVEAPEVPERAPSDSPAEDSPAPKKSQGIEQAVITWPQELLPFKWKQEKWNFPLGWLPSPVRCRLCTKCNVVCRINLACTTNCAHCTKDHSPCSLVPSGKKAGLNLNKEQRLYFLFTWCQVADKFTPHPKEDTGTMITVQSTTVPPWFLALRKERAKEYGVYHMRIEGGTSSTGSQKRNRQIVPTPQNETGRRPFQIDSQSSTAMKRPCKAAKDSGEDDDHDLDDSTDDNRHGDSDDGERMQDEDADEDGEATPKPPAKRRCTSQPTTPAKGHKTTKEPTIEDDSDYSMEVAEGVQAKGTRSQVQRNQAPRLAKAKSSRNADDTDNRPVAANNGRSKSARLRKKQKAHAGDSNRACQNAESDGVDEQNPSIYDNNHEAAGPSGCRSQSPSSVPKTILRVPPIRDTSVEGARVRKTLRFAVAHVPGAIQVPGTQVPEGSEVPDDPDEVPGDQLPETSTTSLGGDERAFVPDYDYSHFATNEGHSAVSTSSPDLLADTHWLRNVSPYLFTSSVEYRPIRPDFDSAAVATTVNWNFNESQTHAGLVWDAVSEIGEQGTHLDTRIADLRMQVDELDGQNCGLRQQLHSQDLLITSQNREMSQLRMRLDCLEAYLLERDGSCYFNYPHPGRALLVPANSESTTMPLANMDGYSQHAQSSSASPLSVRAMSEGIQNPNGAMVEVDPLAVVLWRPGGQIVQPDV